MFVSDDARGPMSKVYAVVGCLLFSMFIVYDTQLIVGVNKWGDPHRCAIKHRCGRLHSSRSCYSAGTFRAHLLSGDSRRRATPFSLDRYQFTEDEYIWGALNLYIDIVQRTYRLVLPRSLCTVFVGSYLHPSHRMPLNYAGFARPSLLRSIYPDPCAYWGPPRVAQQLCAAQQAY